MKKKILLIPLALLLIMSLIATGCPAPPVKEVTVGVKGWSEPFIMGELMKQVLEERGFEVELVTGLTTVPLRGGLEAGDLDIVSEYTGTGWMVHLGQLYEPGIDNNQLYRLVKEADEGNGFIWLDPIWNNNTYVWVSPAKFAKEHNLKTLSDLAAFYREKEGKVTTFVDTGFELRPDGLPAMQKHYDFKVHPDFLLVGMLGVIAMALEAAEADVGMSYATEATIVKYDWHLYPDDKAFFPPYDMTPVVRADTLEKYPEIADILNELVATFPGGGELATLEIVAAGQKAWQELNAKVDIEGMLPAEAARDYLVKHGLIKE